MKLIIERLGRIRSAEIELRPLTLFIGENGTNKTWAAHSLYSILERMRVQAPQPADPDDSSEELRSSIEAQANRIAAKATVGGGVVEWTIERAELLSALPALIDFRVGERRWVSVLGFQPAQSPMVTLRLTREEFADGVGASLDLAIDPVGGGIRRDLRTIHAPTAERTTRFAATGTDRLAPRVADEIERLLFAWRNRVRVLPVEREHLAQVYPVLVSRPDTFKMPRALVDFCNLLNEGRDPRWPGQGNALRDALRALLGGSFEFNGPQKELEFVFRDGDSTQSIPVRAAASLSKSLAGLDVFLETAGPGDILIVDEPEMNAHPRAQVALVELFALMIRAGMRLVVVTHSPYIVDHLVTLMEASKLDAAARTTIATTLELKNPDAYVAPDDVAVWQFGTDGEVRNVLDRERHAIDWSTFTQVTRDEGIAFDRILATEAPDRA